MNFYIADDDPDTIDLLSDLIENDFNNSIVGVADNPQQAYDDLLKCASTSCWSTMACQ